MKVCDVPVLDLDAVTPDQGLFQGYKSTPGPPGPPPVLQKTCLFPGESSCR